MTAAQRAALANTLTPQQIMILDAFQSEVYVQGRMDVQHEPLYDTVTIAAGATVNANTSAFFTNVGPASGKTLAQTNLTQSRRLPAPEAFSAFAIRLRWQEDIVMADALALVNTFAFQLFLGQKPYNTGPLWHFNAGGGILSDMGGKVIAAVGGWFSNGVPGRESMHKLAVPIVIENQMEFYAQLTGNPLVLQAAGGGTLGTGLILTCLLDGLHARGVQ